MHNSSNSKPETEYYLELFDQLPSLMWRAGLDGKCNFFNRSWLEFTGRRLEQELGDGWLAGIHPQDVERVVAIYRRSFNARQPFEVEYRLQHHSGEYRWILNIGRPFNDPHGNFAGYLGPCYDLTERKTMEKTLHEREAMFKGLFEYAPDAVVVVDEQGRILLTNQQVQHMFGYQPSEIVGQPVETLMPAPYRQRHQQHVVSYQDQPHPRPMGAGLELYGQRKNGELFPVDITLGPLALGDKKLTLATIRDITERKQAEKELENYRDNLEELVEARTAELQREITERQRAEDQIRSHQVRLQNYANQLSRSNRDLQDFASIVSHDLQEPLRKIQAFGERLQSRLDSRYGDTLDADTRLYIDRMRDAAERMSHLLQSLLAYSRLSIRRDPYSEVDLNTIVASVVSDLEIRLEESGGQVQVGPLPVLEADRLQMHQLFQNLIGNGLKYHRPGVPPQVRVYQPPATAADNGDQVQIIVEDNGIGFDEAFVEKIFQPFQRLHGRNEYEGTGIGLAICRKIAERHGGSITAHSQEGQGATFIITLPVKQTGPER